MLGFYENRLGFIVIDTIIAVFVIGLAVIWSMVCAFIVMFCASAYLDYRKNVSKQKASRNRQEQPVPSVRETGRDNSGGTLKPASRRKRSVTKSA